MGTKYFYEGNNDPSNGTEKITGVGPDGTEELVVGGEARELTDEQYATLAPNYQLVTEAARSQRDKEQAGSQEDPSQQPVSATTSDTPEETTPESTPAAPSGAGKRGGRQS